MFSICESNSKEKTWTDTHLEHCQQKQKVAFQCFLLANRITNFKAVFGAHALERTSREAGDQGGIEDEGGQGALLRERLRSFWFLLQQLTLPKHLAQVVTEDMISEDTVDLLLLDWTYIMSIQIRFVNEAPTKPMQWCHCSLDTLVVSMLSSQHLVKLFANCFQLRSFPRCRCQPKTQPDFWYTGNYKEKRKQRNTTKNQVCTPIPKWMSRKPKYHLLQKIDGTSMHIHIL